MNGQIWGRDANNNLVELYFPDVTKFEKMRRSVKRLNNKKALPTDDRWRPFNQLINVASNDLPDFRESVRLDQNDEVGRYFETIADIGACEKVGECRAFAAVFDKTEHPYCLTCHQTVKKFILCN